MRHIALLVLCGFLSACSILRDPPPDEIVVAAAPVPAPAPDTLCQQIARQDAAPHFTAMTQRGIFERSYAQCAAMFY